MRKFTRMPFFYMYVYFQSNKYSYVIESLVNNYKRVYIMKSHEKNDDALALFPNYHNFNFNSDKIEDEQN